jgi:hypothetical protein
MTVALNPGTARKFARDYRIRRQAAYSRYRVSIPGRVEAEDRRELAKVNGAGPGSAEKAECFSMNPAPAVRKGWRARPHKYRRSCPPVNMSPGALGWPERIGCQWPSDASGIATGSVLLKCDRYDYRSSTVIMAFALTRRPLWTRKFYFGRHYLSTSSI